MGTRLLSEVCIDRKLSLKSTTALHVKYTSEEELDLQIEHAGCMLYPNLHFLAGATICSGTIATRVSIKTVMSVRLIFCDRNERDLNMVLGMFRGHPLCCVGSFF